MNWDIEPNKTLKRREIHMRWGGQWQGGISTPSNSEHILIFTDPVSGQKYGYDRHEGLREDGSYAYTGEGQIGDQEFRGGNKAILETLSNGKIIRLFRAKSPDATYIGEFVLGEPAYSMQTTNDVEGNPRKAIIFNLVPLNASTALLPSFGGPNPIQVQPRDWMAPKWDDYQVQQKFKSDDGATASRVEFKLQSDLGNWLLSIGHCVKVLPIKVGNSSIVPDLFDETSNVIIEAKKSPARGFVRTAIGQVLDYQNNLSLSGMEVEAAILLPSPPADDLVALCEHLGIDVIVPEMDGGFRSILNKPVF